MRRSQPCLIPWHDKQCILSNPVLFLQGSKSFSLLLWQYYTHGGVACTPAILQSSSIPSLIHPGLGLLSVWPCPGWLLLGSLGSSYITKPHTWLHCLCKIGTWCVCCEVLWWTDIPFQFPSWWESRLRRSVQTSWLFGILRCSEVNCRI